jgi:uncharacterized protein (TIGR02145 family)
MSFKLGNTNISEMYVGSTKIAQAYVGSTKVYEAVIPIQYYNVYISQTSGGTIYASPTYGSTGTEITLSNTPDTGYEFVSYNINGATLKNTNQFDIGYNDVYVSGSFRQAGPVLNYVQIGTQKWLSGDLAYDDGQGGIYAKTITSAGVNIGVHYYYTKDAARRVANSIEGWHLPSRDEWNTFSNYIGSNVNSIKSTTGWNSSKNGNNSTGFNAYPTGWYTNSTTSKQIGTLVAYPSSNDYSSSSLYAMRLRYDDSYMSVTTLSQSYLYPVRLIKDS